MSDQAETIKRRIFVGGLFPEVQSTDLRDKFSGFGNVDEIQIKVRKDEKGTPVKTFAYLNITGNKKDFDKCFSTFNRAKWKGSMLVLQNAKESFLTKLEKERADPDVQVSPRVKDTPPTPHDPLAQVPGVKDFVMRGAVPGTPIPGERNWVVGKYGRVMPIVHLKKSDKKKIVRVDPSKLCHNLKKLKDTTDQDADMDVDSLTWNIKGEDKEITRKRKGEFDQTSNKSKSIRTGSKAKMVMEFLADRERRFAEVVKEANDFEIVQRDGAVKKNAGNSRSSKTPLKQTSKKSSEISNLKNSRNYTSSDSDRGSADTDEIIASTKSSAQKKSNVTHQASQSFLDSHSGDSSDSDSDPGDEESSSFVFIPGKKAGMKKVLSLPSASPSVQSESSEKKKIKSEGGQVEKASEKKLRKNNMKVSDSDSEESDMSEDTEESDSDEADVNGFEFKNEADESVSSDDYSSPSDEDSDTSDDDSEYKSEKKSTQGSQQTGKKRIFELPEFKGRTMLDNDSTLKSGPAKAVVASSASSDDDSNDDDMSSSDEETKSASQPHNALHSKTVKTSSISKKEQKDEMESDDSSSDDTSSSSNDDKDTKPSKKAVTPDSVLKGLKSSEERKVSDSDDDSSEDMSSDNELINSKLQPDSKTFKASPKQQQESMNSDDSDEDTSSDEDLLKENNSAKRMTKIDQESSDDSSDEEKEMKTNKSFKLNPVSNSKSKPVLSKMEIDNSSDSADTADTDEILATIKKSKKTSAQQAEVSNPQFSKSPVPVSRKSGGSLMDEFSCGFVVNDDKIVYPDIDSSDSDSDDSQDDIPVKKMKPSKSSEKNNTSTSKSVKVRQINQDKDKDASKGNDQRGMERKEKDPKDSGFTEKESLLRREEEKKAKRLSPLDKHIDDNRRRLETIKERSRELESKKALVQQALAQVDTGSRLNKKIVFDSDDDMDETESLSLVGTHNTTETEKEKPDLPKKKKQLTLFDSSGSENSDADSSDEDRFRIRPQYEGEKGKKLMQLQSRFGNDERFRIDERFVESEEEEGNHKEIVVEEDGESERSRTLRILEGVVGRQPVARLLKHESQRKTFKDTTALHFDPTIEEHSQFEIKAEAKEKAPKKKNKKKSKKDEEEDFKEEEMPEVSKERSYEVTSVLQDAFKSREDKPSGFSLLAAFGKKDQESDLKTDEATMQTITRTSRMMHPWESRFRVDSSDESMSSEDEAATKQSSEKTKSSEKDVLFPVRKTTFFFTEDDDRLDEGVTFFRRPDDFEAVIEQWRENRPKLVESYKEKLRKAVKNRRKLQLQKTILRRNAQRGGGRRRTEER